MTTGSGVVIYFDGPDGAGKTTQLQLAAAELKKKGLAVLETRSVGGTPIGELLREASLSANDRPVETDLHIALACQHALVTEIKAARAKQDVILVDRSPLSIIAYQVYGDGLNWEDGYHAAEELIGLIKPELIIVYKGDGAELETRRHNRNDDDYFEKKPADYHRRVAGGFEAARQRFDAKIIDASRPVDEVHRDTMELIDAILTA